MYILFNGRKRPLGEGREGGVREGGREGGEEGVREREGGRGELLNYLP